MIGTKLTLYRGSKTRINDRIVDRGPTVAKIVGLDVALIIGGCQKVNVVGTIAGRRARV